MFDNEPGNMKIVVDGGSELGKFLFAAARDGGIVDVLGIAFMVRGYEFGGKSPAARFEMIQLNDINPNKMRKFESFSPPPSKPIPMRLPCPECKALHVDEGAFAKKLHHTHACQNCGNVWRPAVVDTVGVRFLPGFKNDEDGFDE